MKQRQTVDLKVPLLFLQEVEDGGGLHAAEADSPQCGRLAYFGAEFLVIYTGATYGPTDISITVETGAAGPIAEGWETVEEGTFTVASTLTMIPHPTGAEGSIDDIAGLTHFGDVVSPGLWHARIHANGRAADRADTAVWIQLWPADHAVARTTVKIGDDFTPQTMSSVPTQPPPAIPKTAAGWSAPEISVAWARLLQALKANGADITLAGLAPGSTREAINAAERSTGLIWPVEARNWYATTNGYLDNNWVALLPEYDLLSLQSCVDERMRQLSIWKSASIGEFADIRARGELTYNAGTDPGQFVADFLPIAERDGNCLVVDLRPGVAQASVASIASDGSFRGHIWRTIGHLVQDLTQSIESATPFFEMWVPVVTDGELDWAYSPVE